MQLDRKQKILLTLFIIALAFLAWQIYDIFFAGDNATTSSTPGEVTAFKSNSIPKSTVPSIASISKTNSNTAPTPTSAPQPQTAQPTPTPPVATQQQTVSTPTVMTAVPNTVTTPAPAALNNNVTATPPMRTMNLQTPLTQSQMEYLRLVNRYQVLRMKRMLMDEEVAIVTSKAKIAELNQQISKTTGTQTTASTLVGQPSSNSPTGYQLLYVDYQQGEWSATLNNNGQFIPVTAGMRLNDGTQILKISQSGVIIQQRGVTYLLNFYGSTRINYSYSKPITPTTNTFYQRPPVANKKPVTRQEQVRAVAVAVAVPNTNTTNALMPNPLANKSGLALTSQQKTTVNQLETNSNNKPTRAYTDSEKQLLNLPEKHFTLQLSSSYRLDDLERLSKEPSLINQTHIFQTYYLGKTLYVLVYGDFLTEQQAIQAMNTLPSHIRQLKPWVRTIESVQAAIKLSPKKD